MGCKSAANTTEPVESILCLQVGCYSLTGSSWDDLEAREVRGLTEHPFTAGKKKKKKRKQNLKDPGLPVAGRLTLGHPNMILAKEFS